MKANFNAELQNLATTHKFAQNLAAATCLQKQADRLTGYLFVRFKSRQVSLDRLFSETYFRQEVRIGLKVRKKAL